MKLLSNKAIESIHVSKTGLPRPAKDLQIWHFAKQNNYSIVTFDADFKTLENIRGFLPKVILFNTGNSSTNYIYGLIIKKLKEIESFISEDSQGILEIY